MTTLQAVFLGKRERILWGLVENTLVKLYVSQDPYITTIDGVDVYRAAATDSANNTYRLIWSILDSWNGDDECDACNWEEFIAIKE